MKAVFFCVVVIAAVSHVAVLSAKRGPLNVTLTVHSDPPGATLYEDNAQNFGTTPARVKYKGSKEFRSGKGCMTTKSLTVRWASGAEASLPAVQMCPAVGGNQQITFVRPTGVPGRELDVQYALQLQQIAVLNEQARSAATAQLWRDLAANLASRRRSNPPVTCTSRVSYNHVYTECN